MNADVDRISGMLTRVALIYELSGSGFESSCSHLQPLRASFFSSLSTCLETTLLEFSVPNNPIEHPRLHFQENLQGVFVMLIVIVLLHRMFFIYRLHFYVTTVCSSLWLLRPVKSSTSSGLYRGYFLLLTSYPFCLAVYGFELLVFNTFVLLSNL